MFELKHIPAKLNNLHIFKGGDVIQVRRGSAVVAEVRITAGSSSFLVDVEDKYMGRVRSKSMTGGITPARLRDHFYGELNAAAFYLKVEVKPEPVTSGMALVHKGRRALEPMQQYKLVPYDKSDTREYRIEVCSEVRHTIAASTSSSILFNVCVIDMKAGTSVYHHVAHISDIPYLEKFYCYLNTGKRWPKASNTVQVTPNGAKAIPEAGEDDDANGQYIIWCPTSDLPPRNINRGAKQAKAVAASMSERHGKTFFWCRLMGKVEQKKVTTTTTEITTL